MAKFDHLVKLSVSEKLAARVAAQEERQPGILVDKHYAYFHLIVPVYR